MKKTIINNYIAIYKPEHHKAMSNGMVYEHILIAEEILGRELKETEVVHHKDRNRMNNKKSNLMIFKTNSDHAKYHMTNKCEKTEDGTYIGIGDDELYKCPICGNQKSKRAKLCNDCYKKETSVKPTKEELEKLLTINNINKISKMYDVSWNAVKKWKNSYNL